MTADVAESFDAFERSTGLQFSDDLRGDLLFVIAQEVIDFEHRRRHERIFRGKGDVARAQAAASEARRLAEAAETLKSLLSGCGASEVNWVEPFRREAFALSQRLVGGKKDSYAFYRRLSVPLIGRFIEDERQRPPTGQYIYVHVILPHPPYIWRENCTQTKATTYGEQLTCATRLMKQLIECLKKEGKYDDALILLQSDHGFQDDLNAKGLLAVSEDARKEISSRQNYFTDDGFFSRLSSLLLIKLPGAPSAPLETSDAQSQLIDVPATVYDALGIAAPPTAGHSVFKLSEIPPREVSVFTGLYRRDGSGKPIVLGRNETKVELSHLKRRPDGTWRVEPPITATHEGW